MSRISSTSQSRRRIPSYQPLVVPDGLGFGLAGVSGSGSGSGSGPSRDGPEHALRSRSRVSSHAAESVASESGMSALSVLSAFPRRPHHEHPYDAETLAQKRLRKQQRRADRERRQLLEPTPGATTTSSPVDPTDSPLRRCIRWLLLDGASATKAVAVSFAIVVLVKWSVGLGGYSGYATPPMRGDFEAQRHWISLASSSLSSRSSLAIPLTSLSIPLHHPASSRTSVPVPIGEWYSHDLGYWGLDYPPLTAYHSYLLGLIARLSPTTAQYVGLRPTSVANGSTSTSGALDAWEANMNQMESEGRLKVWMRATVVGGDAVLWITAVAWYCWSNFGTDFSRAASSADARKSHEKALRRTLVAALTILLQPALILIDNGHFQYNSLMLALTLWSINAFQSGHDLLGSALFVVSLGFKQMALYYAPGVFAYLFGKCLWLGGRDGLNLFLHLGLTVAISFTLVFLPFLSPFPTAVLQALNRIFPFARGLFEDKVANFWCALNVVIKLRHLASVATLARLSLVTTLLAVLPSTVGVVWISYRLGQQRANKTATTASSSRHHDDDGDLDAAKTTTTTTTTSSRSRLQSSRGVEGSVIKRADRPCPTSHLLPHLLVTSSLSFFLFSFQVHEKSILLPLMPLTLLMGARERGYGRLDWEWGVLLNNVAVFSMYPLLKKDGLTSQYLALTVAWNYLIGYNPLRLRSGSFIKFLSLTAYGSIATVHLLELIATPPPHLPDLYPVLNLTLSAGVFGLGWLWVGKRLGQEGWAIGGF